MDHKIPWWIRNLSVPPGWLVGRHTGSGTLRPWRIAVCGPQSDGGWDACETLTVFGYTGFPPDNVLHRHADCALRSLDSFDVVSRILITPRAAGPYAIRSSGYVAAAGLLIWTQYSYYVIGSESLGQGRLVEQCLFAKASNQPRYVSAIDELAGAAMQSFVTATAGA